MLIGFISPRSNHPQPPLPRAFAWICNHQTGFYQRIDLQKALSIPLNALKNSLGVNWKLLNASAVSSNGQIIAGYGYRIDPAYGSVMTTEAWVAQINLSAIAGPLSCID